LGGSGGGESVGGQKYIVFLDTVSEEFLLTLFPNK